MEKELTAYDYGYNFASWLISHEATHELSPFQTQSNLCEDIPVEDYREMRDAGIETNSMEYWKGFNACIDNA